MEAKRFIMLEMYFVVIIIVALIGAGMFVVLSDVDMASGSRVIMVGETVVVDEIVVINETLILTPERTPEPTPEPTPELTQETQKTDRELLKEFLKEDRTNENIRSESSIDIIYMCGHYSEDFIANASSWFNKQNSSAKFYFAYLEAKHGMDHIVVATKLDGEKEWTFIDVEMNSIVSEHLLQSCYKSYKIGTGVSHHGSVGSLVGGVLELKRI